MIEVLFRYGNKRAILANVKSIMVANILRRWVSPTNLAGPGLDIVFLLSLWILWLMFFVYAARRIFKKDKNYFLPFFIHIFGFIALFVAGMIG